MKVYNPKADEFDIDNKINILKNLPSDNLNISILNSRWDSMNRITSLLKKELKLFKNVKNINSHKISHSEPTDITLLNHVTDWSHFAILGLANWGACTAWSCHDGSYIRKNGTQTILLVTEAFEKLAKVTLKSRGMPDLPYFVFPHQTEQMDEDDLKPHVIELINLIEDEYLNESKLFRH